MHWFTFRSVQHEKKFRQSCSGTRFNRLITVVSMSTIWRDTGLKIMVVLSFWSLSETSGLALSLPWDVFPTTVQLWGFSASQCGRSYHYFYRTNVQWRAIRQEGIHTCNYTDTPSQEVNSTCIDFNARIWLLFCPSAPSISRPAPTSVF